MDPELKRRLDRIDEKLTNLLTKQKEEKWVTASFLREATGWSIQQIRKARMNGVVEFKNRESGGIVYRLGSINPLLINQHKQGA